MEMGALGMPITVSLGAAACATCGAAPRRRDTGASSLLPLVPVEIADYSSHFYENLIGPMF